MISFAQNKDYQKQEESAKRLKLCLKKAKKKKSPTLVGYI